VHNKTVYLALGAAADGTREVLGLSIEQNEGTEFWIQVMNELRNRSLEDILIAVVDGLKGFPEAITATSLDAQVQTCIVRLDSGLTYQQSDVGGVSKLPRKNGPRDDLPGLRGQALRGRPQPAGDRDFRPATDRFWPGGPDAKT
jgi:hypothetical protein